MTATATPNKTDELLQRLTKGVETLTSSEEWVRYLDVQRRFHQYSFGNVMLIALQRPGASRVAGFHRWLELGRHVRRGEKGIAILAPIVSRLKVENEETGETQTVVSTPRNFRVVHVFDISQTEGEDLPEVCSRLQGDDPAGAYAQLLAFAHGLGFTVEDAELPGSTNGDCTHALHRIRVEVRNAPAQRVKTLAHEIAHAILHETFEDRALAELEAESVAFIVMSTLGLSADEYSFGYVAGWAGSAETAVAAIKVSGNRIQKTADDILSRLEAAAATSITIA